MYEKILKLRIVFFEKTRIEKIPKQLSQWKNKKQE